MNKTTTATIGNSNSFVCLPGNDKWEGNTENEEGIATFASNFVVPMRSFADFYALSQYIRDVAQNAYEQGQADLAKELSTYLSSKEKI